MAVSNVTASKAAHLLPSTSTASGARARPCTARVMASMAACRMFTSSIVSRSTTALQHTKHQQKPMWTSTAVYLRRLHCCASALWLLRPPRPFWGGLSAAGYISHCYSCKAEPCKCYTICLLLSIHMYATHTAQATSGWLVMQ